MCLLTVPQPTSTEILRQARALIFTKKMYGTRAQKGNTALGTKSGVCILLNTQCKGQCVTKRYTWR